MYKIHALIFSLLLSVCAFAQNKTIDSLEKTFTYQHGSITLKDGIGTLDVPSGFKYLDAVQAEKVLVEIWNNPKSENISMGFLLPEKQGVLDVSGYVFNIQYDAIGYVKDDDANDINYDELLTTLKEEAVAENESRKKEGYGTIEIVGWASKPFYDKTKNVLHWAKEIRFEGDSVNTLNYNVRVLGRKGVLVLNAISTMGEIDKVKAGVPHVLNVVHFSEGMKYADFNPGVDDVATWTIGGLVAGKVLAKVGFFALILKFWKLIAVGVVAAFAAVKRLFFGKKNEEEDELKPALLPAEDEQKEAN
jgi:uncharacterized membrane-anchored protein